MTTIEIRLPDELARRARQAGLLSNEVILQLLEDAMRRRSGRALLAVARGIHEAGFAPMSMEEIEAEVRLARADRRARLTVGREAGDELAQGAGSP